MRIEDVSKVGDKTVLLAFSMIKAKCYNPHLKQTALEIMEATAITDLFDALETVEFRGVKLFVLDGKDKKILGRRKRVAHILFNLSEVKRQGLAFDPKYWEGKGFNIFYNKIGRGVKYSL